MLTEVKPEDTQQLSFFLNECKQLTIFDLLKKQLEETETTGN